MQKKIIYIITVFCLLFLNGCNLEKQDVTVATGSDAVCYSSEFITEADDSQDVPVYVCGAVCNPGVYYIPVDSIKQDALLAAGGFAEGACENYVNLAEAVFSGERIYFPYEEELGEGYSPVSYEGSTVYEGDYGSQKVNINLATADILMTLPGIGAGKAQAIIDYRESVSPFYKIEDIKNVAGIKDNIYNNIKDSIVVN